jgi:hypothetical protein
MAAPKVKQELRRRISVTETPDFHPSDKDPSLGTPGEDCRLGAVVFYLFLLNLYSMPTEIAKLTSFCVMRGA